ncbi:hypothetical protein, partial [Burkholderia ubonensis]|uniref:hypothetical protein n=1 Tax=Burkholderia ubonensis TaxID=101571 RepID=UPI001E4290B1
MVIRLSGCISHVLVAVSLSFFVQYGYSRDITRLTIDGVGLSKNANDRGIVEACKTFVPTLSQVRRYFLKAYPVESWTCPCMTGHAVTLRLENLLAGETRAASGIARR